MKKDNNIVEKENNLFMMFITSLLLFSISIGLSYFTFEIHKKFTFKFPKQTVFIDTEGIQEYTIAKLRDKLNFVFSANTRLELQLFLEKIVLLKNKDIIINNFKTFFENHKLLGKNIEILQITKIYGKSKEIKGNKKITLDTNSKYRIYIRTRDFEETQDYEYFTIDLIINPFLKIIDFKYYKNDNLKEFYKSLKLSEQLTLRNLPNFINQRTKNKIAVRNLFIKPTGTEFKVLEVVYTKAQIRIIVSIDYKKYSLIYKKGEIVNVIKLKNKHKKTN